MTLKQNSSAAIKRSLAPPKFPFSETIMTPLCYIKRTAMMMIATLFIALLPGFSTPANADFGSPIFHKSGHQVDCDYVEFKLTYTKPNFKWLDEATKDSIVAEAIRIRDVLPEGLSIESATIAGDVTGPGGGLMLAPEIQTTTHANDTLVWKKLHLSKTDLDGLADPENRQFTITILAKIDKSKFAVPKLISNQAKASGPSTTFSHDPALPEDGDPVNGDPTELLIDVSDCPEDTGGGDPVGDVCFKVINGEVECDLDHPGDFIYKMTVGAEYGGKVIELTSTTPGVSIFPPSQIVPAGGGVLAWSIHGAVPGMSIHLVANGLTDGDVKHVAGPKDGLGLCCVQKITIVIPIDIDCPKKCEEGDEDCPPPPPPPCEEGDEDCPPPPPPCDPEIEICDPPEEDGKPELRLEKKVIGEWCLLGVGVDQALCTYQIRIRNVGSGVYAGPLTVRDRYPNGAPISSNFSPVPPWACGPDGAPDKFECTRNIILPPMAETILTVEAVVSKTDYPSREVKNCAKLEQQAGSPTSCAIAKLPDPDDNPKTPDLKLAKTCESGPVGSFSPATVTCRITVTNSGAAPAVGPISINDVTTFVGGGGAITIDSVTPDAPAADWTCSALPAENLNCSIDGANVGPGVSRYFDMSFSSIELTQQRYKNCVEGLVSGGGDVHTFDSVCVEGGADDPAGPPAPNDPNDISVEKTGDSVCDSENPCNFEITLKNGSNTDFSGKLAIIDGITNTAGGLVPGAGITVTPPFGCAVEPTALPFGCVADVTLGAGQSRTHKVIVTLPENDNNAPANSSVPLSSPTGMRNCVLIGEAGILSADIGDTLEGAGSAQANEGSPRYACHDFDTEETKAEQCTSGMVLNNAGNCQCPSGTRWNGRRCFSDVPPISITDPIPPVIGKDPVCPRGMDRFNSFKGKPLGYALKTVRSNGGSIICGEPRCDRGWSLYKNRSAIPRDWTKKQIGRPNSRYKFWCAKAAQKPSLQCWNDSWTQIKSSQASTYRAKRYTVKPRSKNGQTIWCARKRPTVNQCPSGWTKFPVGQVPSGWNSLKRLYDNGRSVCAKPGTVVTPPLTCWSGWTKVWLGEVASYKGKGYKAKSRGKGKRKIWCVKPGKPQSCVPGPNEYRNKQNQCVCKRNYSRGSSGICLKNFTAPRTCDKPWKQISPNQIGTYKNKGWKIKNLGGNGIVPVICAKPGAKQCKANEVMTSDGCLCKAGYQRDQYRRCVKKPTTPTLECRKGWSKVSRSRLGFFKKQGYSIEPRGKGNRRIWCVKPGNKPTGPTISCSGGGKPMRTSSSVNAQWYCSCPNGKKAVKAGKNHYRCINVVVPQTCAKGQTKVTSSKAYRRYKNLGWSLSRKKGYWCGKPGKIVVAPQTCAKGQTKVTSSKAYRRYKNLGWSLSRKKGYWCGKPGKIVVKPKPTCKSIGKIGKWPRCRKKPVISTKPNRTCAQIGKIGRWPKCRNKPIIRKPKLTCGKIGKIGKWPNCRNRPVIKFKPSRTCKSIGKAGKWPKCYTLKKAFRPNIKFKPKGQQIK